MKRSIVVVTMCLTLLGSSGLEGTARAVDPGTMIPTLATRTAPGDLDPTFGGDGIVRTDLTPAEEDGYAVAIQPDGKIVVAGEMGTGSPNPSMAIVRYETNGSLDPSFGGGDG